MRRGTLLALLSLLTVWLGADAFQSHSPILRQRVVLPTKFVRQPPLPFSPTKQQHRRGPSSTSSSSPSSTTALSSSLASALGSPIGAISILLTVVLIHEAGHYTAARICGVKVQEFSIGFGPKVLSFDALGNGFSLRALPLGGYVSFPPNFNETQAEIVERRNTIQDANDLKPWERKFYNSISFGAFDKSIDELKEKEEKRIAKESKNTQTTPFWKRLFSRGENKEASSTRSFSSLDEIEYFDDPDLLQNRPWPQRAVVIAGGVVFNLLLAFSIYFGMIAVGDGLAKPTYSPGVAIDSIISVSAPAKGYLESGDVIVGINGNALSTKSMAEKITTGQSQQEISSLISQIKATPQGESVELSVLRKANPTKETNVVIQPKPGDNGVQSIGVMLGPRYLETERITADSPFRAAVLAFQSVKEITTETADGLASVFAMMLSGKQSGQQLSGPIGLVRTGSEVVSSTDLSSILFFMAAISVNLAVVNSFPIPALDGGQMVFILWEAATGKQVDEKLQEAVTGIAVLFLLLVSLGTTVSDVQSLFR